MLLINEQKVQVAVAVAGSCGPILQWRRPLPPMTEITEELILKGIKTRKAGRSEVIGVFATPAPFIGKLVISRVLHSVAAVSMLKKFSGPLYILSGIADHFSSPDAPRSPLCSVIVPPGVEVFV